MTMTVDVLTLINALATIGWAGGYAALFVVVHIYDHHKPASAIVAAWLLANACGAMAIGLFLPSRILAGRALAVVLILVAETILIAHALFTDG